MMEFKRAFQRLVGELFAIRVLVVDAAGTVLAFVSDAIKVADQTVHAGARRSTSTTESYESVKEDWNYTIVDLADATPVTIYDGPAILGNAIVETAMSAHAVTIDDGTTTVMTLPASSAVDYNKEQFKGTRFETSLKMAPNAASAGTVVVLWRKL